MLGDDTHGYEYWHEHPHPIFQISWILVLCNTKSREHQNARRLGEYMKNTFFNDLKFYSSAKILFIIILLSFNEIKKNLSEIFVFFSMMCPSSFNFIRDLASYSHCWTYFYDCSNFSVIVNYFILFRLCAVAITTSKCWLKL